MNLSTLEQHYQTLRRDFAAGRIDAAVFASAVDRLGFQDSQGRCWLLGIQSGTWYCYDGQTGRWHPADPWNLPDTAPLAANKPKRGSLLTRLGVMSGLAGLLVLAWLVWPVGGAPVNPDLTKPLPLPTPTLLPLLDDSQAEPKSGISGSIIDLSSGQPGVDIRISIGEAVVRSDVNGNFNLIGLNAGIYEILPQLEGRAMPAQGPIFVNLDGQSRAIVNLAYYSQTQPLPTDTPQVTISAIPIAATPAPAATPPALPAAGAPANNRPLLLVGLGLALILSGAMLKTYSLPESVRHE